MDSNPLPFAQTPAFLRLLHPQSQPICTPIMLYFAPLLAAELCGGLLFEEGSRPSDVAMVGILTFATPGYHMWTPRRLMDRRDKRASPHSPPG
jgi:hypothetical protein